ncbi:unnamed protein product [Meganyctiphanes norvegica]|uniref:Uncharacterized protein n=1 Tax=Meganyctiphanes norvegica TaxID=48144 RepID=A0AAV2QCL6_MEGNR
MSSPTVKTATVLLILVVGLILLVEAGPMEENGRMKRQIRGFGGGFGGRPGGLGGFGGRPGGFGQGVFGWNLGGGRPFGGRPFGGRPFGGRPGFGRPGGRPFG